MATALQLLVIDESEDDARLIVRQLQHGGYEVVWERVATAAALTAALQHHAWNVLTCEWHVPQCSQATTLAILKAHAVDVPVIIVSGQVEDALGVTAMRNGVHDFVNKRHLARLCPAIEREVRAATLRRTARHVEQELWLGNEIATQLSEGVFLIRTSDQRIAFTNRRFDQMFGYAPGELIGKHVSVLNAPTDKSPEETAGEIAAALAKDKRWQGEVYNCKQDGSYFWCYASVSTFEHSDFGPVWVSVHQDITDRKRSEDALRESEERFKTIFEEAPLGVALVDSLTGRIYEANARFAAITGRTRAELATIDWISITHPDDVQADLDNMALLNAGKIPGYTMQKRYLRPDGSRVWIQLTVAPVTTVDPQHPRHMAMIDNITEHKQLHEQVLRTKSFLDSIVENIPNMVFVKDAQSLAFVLFNRAGEELLGQRRADLIGKTDYDFFPKAQADFFTGKDRAVLREQVVLDIPEELINTGHGQRILHTKKIPILDDTGTPAYLLGISEDITDLKHAQEQLHSRQAELAHALRVTTLGEITAELAHEIHQPMSAIANYANGCRRLIASGATSPNALLPAIEAIATEALRAGGIIRRLRALLQKQATPYQDTDLNAVVTNAVHVLAPQARQLGIPIRVDLAPELPRMQLDQIQIEQVIVNLMLNALEAMQMGEAVEPELLLHTVCPGDGTVEVRVEDRGTGLAPAISKQMFEPFFTSKPSGLGMGLSISRSIVERHGGRLWATNNTSGGATFHIALPLVVEKGNGKPAS